MLHPVLGKREAIILPTQSISLNDFAIFVYFLSFSFFGAFSCTYPPQLSLFLAVGFRVQSLVMWQDYFTIFYCTTFQLRVFFFFCLISQLLTLLVGITDSVFKRLLHFKKICIVRWLLYSTIQLSNIFIRQLNSWIYFVRWLSNQL